MAPQCGDGRASEFAGRRGCPPGAPIRNPNPGTVPGSIHRRTNRGAVSQRNQHFIANQVQANLGWFGPIKEVGRDCLPHIVAEFVPGTGLREDALGEALSTEPSVTLLNHLKDDFFHNRILHWRLVWGNRETGDRRDVSGGFCSKRRPLLPERGGVCATRCGMSTAIMRARQATMHKVSEGARLVQEQTSGLSPSTRFPHE